MGQPAAPAAEPSVRLLQTIAERYGTPTFAYDLDRIRQQVAGLRASFPPSVDILYSLKANPSPGLCRFIAGLGLGADVASAGELLVALQAGFPRARIFVSGPYKSPELLRMLETSPEVVLSLDSVSELATLARKGYSCRAVLRLRPDFTSSALVETGPDARFGIPFPDLRRCRPYLSSSTVLIGFHVFAGSQVLDPAAVVHHLRSALDLSLRAAEVLQVVPQVLNLGGGFGVPYSPDEQELDLGPIAEELETLMTRAAPARIVLELGRYLVAQAGWYLTTVVARQWYKGRRAVVVDGGTHQRADLCRLGLSLRALPPVVLNGRTAPLTPTDVLGCLCLPTDILAEACLLPPLAPGDVLGFPNVGAYGLTAAPALFLSHSLPAEVAFDSTSIALLRARLSVADLLALQERVLQHTPSLGPA